VTPDQQGEQIAKTGLDVALAASALSSPVWLSMLQTYVGLFMLLGGALLLVLRLAIAWREWRAK